MFLFRQFKTPDFDAETLIFSSSFEVVLNDVGNKSIRSAPYLMKQYQKDAIDLWKLLSYAYLQQSTFWNKHICMSFFLLCNLIYSFFPFSKKIFIAMQRSYIS